MSVAENIKPILSALHSTIDKPHSAAKALPGGFYTDPDFLQYETEHLFYKEWLCIGRAEEAAKPGDYWTTELFGEPLLIVRGDDNNLRVLANICRHRGMPVAQDSGHSSQFLCPYHNWSYDLRGQLQRTPLFDQRADFDPTQCRLPEVVSTVWQGFLFVNLDGKAAPLQPRLKGLEPLLNNYHISDMQHCFGEQESWATNWKCLTENFMEGYHLSTVHYQTLHTITPTRLCEHFPAGDGYFGYFSHYPKGFPQRGYHHPDLSEAELGYSVMFAIPPALVAGVAGHSVSYICLQPDSADSVRAKTGMAYLGIDGEQQQRQTAIDLFRRIMAEDKVQLVNLQRGLNSRYYQPGPLAPADYEGNVWDFYHYMAKRLT